MHLRGLIEKNKKDVFHIFMLSAPATFFFLFHFPF